MKRTQFKKDPDLMFLIQPMGQITFLKLQDEIIHNGCSVPVFVWNDFIIGGIEEYDICCRLNRPFNVRRLLFMSKNEVMSFICDEQLKRNDLKSEIRKYLLGKKYECELKIANDIVVMDFDAVMNHEENHKRVNKKELAEHIGKPYALSPGTILKYRDYMNAVDYIRDLFPAAASKILSGQLKISHANILLLGRLSRDEMAQIITSVEDYEIDHLSTADINRFLKWKRHGERQNTTGIIREDEPLIRKMPAYDPDSEICSLVLTIPSWIGSISKSVSQSDLKKASPSAIDRLRSSLYELRNAIGVAEAAILEVQRNG